ncbi:MAG TPA: winged helix-turn-helix domain-containing protein [Terracidiphilus sp.]|nr:winged helix-turn-helix domain-containing protein [Terracidiphilus sp.]
MTAGAEQRAKQLYEFGPFRVDPEKELLLRGEETVPLAPKTFQILLVLMRHKKSVVTKDELMKSVWPDTFVEEANLSRNIFLLRKALGESPQDHQYIVTVPGRGYRFAEEVQHVPEQELSIVAASHAKVQIEVKESSRGRWLAIAAVILLILAAGAAGFFYFHRSKVLTEKDTIVIADFANSTGDPVFDGTLRQGLAVELEQSPFLTLIPDQRIQQTLRLMGQPPDARITPQIARDLCQRTQSAAYLTGSIASLGNQFVLGLKAVSCALGEVLADEQETASGKEKVLAALDTAAGKLRGKLGESLSTVEKFDTPLEQATTPSLEALQAYTLGRRTQVGKDEFAAAIPFLQRAIRFDPNFAVAYALLGSLYWNIGETVQGAEYARRAYELHAPVSEPERFYIESTYYHYVVGDLDKARQVYEVCIQSYPRNSSAPIRLFQLYGEEGKYQDALPQIREANRLDPSKEGLTSADLVDNLTRLNRFQEAGVAAQQTIAKGFDSSGLRLDLYRLAFLDDDASGMARQVQWITGKQNPEAKMFELQAQTAAYSGHLRESRDLSRQAIALAMRLQERENATDFEANAALQEALFGNMAAVRLLATPALGIPTGRQAQFAAALSFAITGDSSRAQSLADDLAKRYPDDTLLRFNFLPSIRAQIALNHNDPMKAIELLQSTEPYELSDVLGFLGPIYVRGEAYLMAHKGTEAAVEFQKIVDHRGIVANSPTGALAYLQLARAYALMDDSTKAKSEYREFLTHWKDADPDIPILQQAKMEYAKL